jgi:hypothetical protein
MTASSTMVIVLAGAAIAAVAAVRSTWSPCGLSMLSTLTPHGERSRGHSYRDTAGWFVAGATVGGACLGGLMAAGAALVRASGLSGDSRLWAAGAAALVAALSDAGLVGWQLPVHHRQVNERWLDEFRPWVYGAGFGWQIGAGLVTYVTSAAVYLLVVLGVLCGSPVAALALGVAFGLLRGLAVLLTARVSSTDALLAFHRRFEAARPLAERAVRVAELGVVVAAAAVLANVASVAVLGVGALAVAAGSVRASRKARVEARPASDPVAAVG